MMILYEIYYDGSHDGDGYGASEKEAIEEMATRDGYLSVAEMCSAEGTHVDLYAARPSSEPLLRPHQYKDVDDRAKEIMQKFDYFGASE